MNLPKRSMLVTFASALALPALACDPVQCSGLPEMEPNFMDSPNTVWLGDTWCGSSFTYLNVDGNIATDFDVFQLELTEMTTVEIEYSTSNFTGYVMLNDHLPLFPVDNYVNPGPCETALLSVDCLPAGTYWIWTYRTIADTIESEEPYALTISGTACGTVDAVELPAEFTLEQNVPNPFNPVTNIRFSLEETGSAKLTVHNIAGQMVATLVDGLMERGAHEVAFDASQLRSGVYFYTLQAGNQLETKKMALVK